MRLRTEVGLAVGALLAIQVITSLGASGLLSRMGPAIQQILRENVRSTEAVEDMLAAIALDDLEPATERQEAFAGALAVAQGNITEPEEGPLLVRIAAHQEAALAYAGPVRLEVVDQLRDLASVNRQSMTRADDEAQRLGFAGAWAAVLLGLASFGTSVVVSRRLSRRIEDPIAEIDAVLAAAHDGDRHRRCRAEAVPDDLRRIVREVNRLLDRPPPEPVLKPAPAADRLALGVLLEDLPEPAVVVAPDGSLRAANGAAHAAMAEDDSLRTALDDLPRSGLAGGWAVRPLPGDGGWICTG